MSDGDKDERHGARRSDIRAGAVSGPWRGGALAPSEAARERAARPIGSTGRMDGAAAAAALANEPLPPPPALEYKDEPPERSRSGSDVVGPAAMGLVGSLAVGLVSAAVMIGLMLYLGPGRDNDLAGSGGGLLRDPMAQPEELRQVPTAAELAAAERAIDGEPQRAQLAELTPEDTGTADPPAPTFGDTEDVGPTDSPSLAATEAAAQDEASPQPSEGNPAATEVDAPSIPPGMAPPRLRVAQDLPRARRDTIIAALRAAGYGEPDLEVLPFPIAVSRVGYYRPQDQEAAETLATFLGGLLDPEGRTVRVRDYGVLADGEPPRRLDIWISG